MKRAIALALLAATSAAAQSPAPGFSKPPPCLTALEAKGLATFVLPGLIDSLAQRCRGTLGRDAFLRQGASEALAKRLRRDAAPSWPVAKSAIEKLNGGQRLPGLFGERFIMGMAESTAADLVLRDMGKSDCAAANDLVEGLAPLPSASFSNVIAALIALGGDSAGDKSPLRICPVSSPERATR